jgi:carbonic anhydrase
MRIRTIALSAILAAIAPVSPGAGAQTQADTKAAPAVPAPDAHAVHWSYDGAGAPVHWGDLSSSNHACKVGDEQSPIDLKSAIPADFPKAAPNWSPVRGGTVVNNGHTIQFDIGGAGGLDIGGVRYDLKQFHFHHPSEHTVDGKSFPLEVHLVHAAPDGRLAVVGVMFEEGASNPALDPVWATAPTQEGKAAVAFEVDPSKFLPREPAAYRYQGSLTTPPCSETVTWTVLAKPITASRSQIQAFASLFPNNARPVQPLNRRFLLKSP